jgi:hypothetical protein
MIKYDLFLNDSGTKQCRNDMIGSFVVSIAHYMRAYFNYQAITQGTDFQLPGDAGYLNVSQGREPKLTSQLLVPILAYRYTKSPTFAPYSTPQCVLIQETAYADTKLYAKIGCMDRETFTSTKLRLHVYTDNRCSSPYDDGQPSRKHQKKYEINGYSFSSKVSFRPPFYSCMDCSPEEISDSFNKKNSNWYDDDYIAENGQKDNEQQDEATDEGDDFYGDDSVDDAYMYANDDVYNNRRRELGEEDSNLLQFTPAHGQLEAYETEFWKEVQDARRSLYDNYYDIGNWNMCERLYTYGVYCDEECRSLEAFRIDEWSRPDVILLSILCTFIAIMMTLIVAKRIKSANKGRIYDGQTQPGLPPLAMAVIFVVIVAVIVGLGAFKFVNETLVFAVVTCILLFIYNLKLTLFEAPRPVLLEAPKHFEVENPLEDHLFS